jgi:hypothetical protein
MQVSLLINDPVGFHWELLSRDHDFTNTPTPQVFRWSWDLGQPEISTRKEFQEALSKSSYFFTMCDRFQTDEFAEYGPLAKFLYIAGKKASLFHNLMSKVTNSLRGYVP